MTNNLKAADFIKRSAHKYHDTTLYTAVVVTIILILQIWYMLRGTA